MRFAGHRVQERLVDDDHPAGPDQGTDGVGRVQDGRRVGGVADDDQVGGRRHEVGAQGVAVVGRELHAVHGHARVGERDLGFGERRVHDGGQAGPETGQQRETLRGAGQDQHLVR